ncbi:MAG: iron-containing alcohol dehydrogenase [Oscillospiraceae bacterium]|nr:iron-containing alcohol dehydrogenase [Oscillospiraceae bacterium]
MDEFNCRTKVYAGAGAVKKLAEFGAKRVFLVTDPFFYKNGTAQRIGAEIKAEKIEYFSDVKPDPSVELAAEGTAKLRAFGADLIIALGGGSAMDCAKAMAYFAKGNARLVAIPTTSGSGSEVTDFAILTHNQVKHPLVDPKLRPWAAILDSDLLKEMPAGLVADSGFDVIAHAVESYVATGAGVFTDALAREAFRSAYALLPASFAGRQEVRLKIHQAATMAGMAFSQAGLGLCHAMAHSLGGMFHVPHGRLNAILLPSIVACNAHVAGHKYAELARSAGMVGSADTVAVRNLKNALIRLRRELKLPETLAQAGVAPREVWSGTKEIVEATLSDPCCATNPMKVEDFMVRRILEEVTGRV